MDDIILNHNGHKNWAMQTIQSFCPRESDNIVRGHLQQVYRRGRAKHKPIQIDHRSIQLEVRGPLKLRGEEIPQPWEIKSMGLILDPKIDLVPTSRQDKTEGKSRVDADGRTYGKTCG